MFKIRTTSQKRFKVKPWFGILDAVSVVDVQSALRRCSVSLASLHAI